MSLRVLRPATLAQAVEHKARCPEALPMAGGTDLLVHWPEAASRHAATYLDLGCVAELRPIVRAADHVRLGATTTYWDVLCDARIGRELPLLHAAARTVGAIQIQTRGTWAGNVANASPAADGVPVLMAYDAVVELESATGTRRVRLDEFYRGYKEMMMRDDEIIAAIEIPLRQRTDERFIKVGSRRAQAITKVGAAIARSDDGWRVVVNSVGPTVRRCRALERHLDQEGAPECADLLERLVAEDVAPIDDIRSTARYRRRVLTRVLEDALGAVPEVRS